MRHSPLKIKYTQLFFLLTVTILLVSCENKTSNQPTNAEGFTAIENELKDKFGKDAYYTDLAIMYNKTIGNMVSVTVTENPESLKMGQWNLAQNSWVQNSEVLLEVPEGTKASDFMFQLNEKINLSTLGDLVEKSREQLRSEKQLNNPALSIASVKFPKNGNLSKTEYAINLEPENGGTTFSFYYTLDGELIKMDY